jgi:hypothetical protein
VDANLLVHAATAFRWDGTDRLIAAADSSTGELL